MHVVEIERDTKYKFGVSFVSLPLCDSLSRLGLVGGQMAPIHHNEDVVLLSLGRLLAGRLHVYPASNCIMEAGG